MKIKKIENYQLEELKTNKIYINKYDMSFIYNYEFAIYIKAFLYDLITEIIKKDSGIKVPFPMIDNTTYFSLEKFKNYIKEHEINIDIQGYVELNDYIPFQEWEKIEGNEIIFDTEEIKLIQYRGLV